MVLGMPTTLGMFGGVVVAEAAVWCAVVVAGFVAVVWAVAAIVRAARMGIEETFEIIVVPV